MAALTDDDKQWISGQREALETRFNKNFEKIETSFDKRFELIETHFNEKFEAIETRFNEKLEAMETRFNEKLEAMETRFDEKLEAMETKLLTAFHQWASPIEMRLRTHATAMRALDLEIEAIKDQLPPPFQKGA